MTDPASRQDQVSRHLPLPPKVFAILLILAHGPRHGYGMMQALRDGAAGQPWMVGPATLYRTLKQLETRKLVAGSDGPIGESEGPPRRYYTLTPLGRRVAGAETARMARLVDAAQAGRLVEER